MPPKKNGFTSSTPAIEKDTATFRGMVDSSVPSSIEESSFVIRNEVYDDISVKKKPNKKLSTYDLVIKAIELEGLPRKGASYMTILKWIIKYKEIDNVGMLKANLKKAILKALENGNLKRASQSKNAIGLRGHFMLNKDVLKKPIQSNTTTKKTVAKKENKDIIERGSLSDTEITKKPRKRNPGRLNKSLTQDGGRKKATSKLNAVVKAKASSVQAPKAKNAPAPKTENAPAPKTENAPVPKTKNAPAPKTKNAPAPKTNKAPAPKTNKAPAPKANKAPASKAKNAPAPKAKKSPVQKAKTTVASTSKPESEISASELESENEFDAILKAKAVIAKKILEEAKPIPKRKMAKAKDDIVPEEPEMSPMKQVPEKSKKKTAPKPTNKNVPRTKKHTQLSRKDLSDTELTVKPVNRKSLKSYSSDTEIVDVKKETKAARSRLKVTDTKKQATDVSEAGPSKPKANGKPKVKNAV